MTFNYGEIEIRIFNNLLEVMYGYSQKGYWDKEAGGVLIGKENKISNDVFIDFITEPMEKDIRARRFFKRKDKGHILFYENLYDKYEGIYGYYGEWHTHPQDIPDKSLLDYLNWKRIGRLMGDRIQYHIIVGVKEIGIWEYNASIKLLKKIVSLGWGEIL